MTTGFDAHPAEAPKATPRTTRKTRRSAEHETAAPTEVKRRRRTRPDLEAEEAMAVDLSSAEPQEDEPAHDADQD